MRSRICVSASRLSSPPPPHKLTRPSCGPSPPSFSPSPSSSTLPVLLLLPPRVIGPPLSTPGAHSVNAFGILGPDLNAPMAPPPTILLSMKPPSDDNRFHIMYSTGLRLLYNVFIGGLSCAAIYRAVRVCVAPSLTTKGFAEVCELPAALYLLWVSIRGFEDLTTFDPTLYLAYGDGLMVLGLASKILLARFWRSYLAHLKLGAGHKFVDPGKPAERQRERVASCAASSWPRITCSSSRETRCRATRCSAEKWSSRACSSVP